MVNASFAGRSYPPTAPYEVGREKIREFAEAVGEHPVHVDPEAARALGYPDVIAPPTFAVIVAQRCDAQLVRDPEAGIDYSRVLHGEQNFTHHRPIVAGGRPGARPPLHPGGGGGGASTGPTPRRGDPHAGRAGGAARH